MNFKEVVLPSPFSRSKASVLIRAISLRASWNSGDSRHTSAQSRSPTRGVSWAGMASSMYSAGLTLSGHTAPLRAKYSRVTDESALTSPKLTCTIAERQCHVPNGDFRRSTNSFAASLQQEQLTEALEQKRRGLTNRTQDGLSDLLTSSRTERYSTRSDHRDPRSVRLGKGATPAC